MAGSNREAKENEMKQRSHNRLRQIGRQSGLLLAMILSLHGCAVQEPVKQPAGPAADSSSPAASAPTPAPEPVALPRRESVPVPEEGKAAGTLLANARQNVRAGKFNQAEMMLERALRLEPRNARLWHEMAQVKYGQKDYGQVIQFCIKSNSLAGKDYGLIRQNWLLMEKGYLQLGEPEKAKQARSKAGSPP